MYIILINKPCGHWRHIITKIMNFIQISVLCEFIQCHLYWKAYEKIPFVSIFFKDKTGILHVVALHTPHIFTSVPNKYTIVL